MMSTLISAVAAPLPRLVHAAGFAILAMVAVGAAQIWQHGSNADLVSPAATPIDAAQPLDAAPSAVDMWRV
jgi:hypothetical protein